MSPGSRGFFHPFLNRCQSERGGASSPDAVNAQVAGSGLLRVYLEFRHGGGVQKAQLQGLLTTVAEGKTASHAHGNLHSSAVILVSPNLLYISGVKVRLVAE